jgi:molybdopterin molybdotransferase
LISVEQALSTVLAHAPALPRERVALESALGRVLAEDALSDLDLPPFDRSAMDGFAVRTAPGGRRSEASPSSAV